MFSLNRRSIICPYCLTEIRTWRKLDKCPKCVDKTLPVQYLDDYEKHPPFFIQVFGRSRVGKTVFLSALTLMLVRMSKVWREFSYAAITDASQRKVEEINKYLASGKMPDITQMGEQEIYMMLLNNMQLWGGRTLVTRDCPGEIFDNLEVPKDQAPFLLNAPTTFMLISMDDLQKSAGHSMDMLMNNYINTLLKNGVNFKKEQRKIVVVLTKADLIPDLPPNLRNYLIDDPLWADINSFTDVEPLEALDMQQYIEVMGRVSDSIRNWIERQPFGLNFLNLAKLKNIELRFSLISSTGAPVDAENKMSVALAPRRVLDPYFWALDLQSCS